MNANNETIIAGWVPLGPGDSEVWVEKEEDREQEKDVEQEVLIEVEYDKENETDKEDK